MVITASEVEKIAYLARLAIEPKDVPLYAENLSNIFNLIAALEQADTQGIEPMAHALETGERFRSDKVTEANQRDALQAVAPVTEAGLYVVPKIINGDE